MNRQSDTHKAAEQVPGESERQVRWNSSVPSQPRYLLVAWILLLLLGVLFLFASLSDLLADVRTGLPTDHLEAFRAISGMTWSQAQLASPGITHFVISLEIAYAVHELVFGVLFLIIVAIPFRQRARSRLVGLLGAGARKPHLHDHYRSLRHNHPGLQSHCGCGVTYLVVAPYPGVFRHVKTHRVTFGNFSSLLRRCLSPKHVFMLERGVAGAFGDTIGGLAVLIPCFICVLVQFIVTGLAILAT